MRPRKGYGFPEANDNTGYILWIADGYVVYDLRGTWYYMDIEIKGVNK